MERKVLIDSEISIKVRCFSTFSTLFLSPVLVTELVGFWLNVKQQKNGNNCRGAVHKSIVMKPRGSVTVAQHQGALQEGPLSRSHLWLKRCKLCIYESSKNILVLERVCGHTGGEGGSLPGQLTRVKYVNSRSHSHLWSVWTVSPVQLLCRAAVLTTLPPCGLVKKQI